MVVAGYGKSPYRESMNFSREGLMHASVGFEFYSLGSRSYLYSIGFTSVIVLLMGGITHHHYLAYG